MIESKRKLIFADIGLVYAAAIWGSTFVIVKTALEGIDPIVMVAYRFLIAGLVLLVYLLFKKKNVLTNLKPSLYLGLMIYVLYITQTIGLQYTTASNSGFITGLFVAFIPLFLKLLFKKSPTFLEIIASLISLCGLWILTGGLEDVNIGDIITIGSAVTYALHVLYSDYYIRKDFDPLILSCQQFLLVGIMAMATALLFGRDVLTFNQYAVYATVFLAIFPTLSAFVIQMFAQKIRSPLRVSLIFALEPVFAALFAWTIGGEEVIGYRAIGGFVIFLALVISGLPVRLFKKTI